MKSGNYDRTARLLHVLYILNSNPKGIAPAKIAEKTSVTTRTTYRDLRDLEDWEHLNVPIIWEGGKCRIEPGVILPPVFFRLHEAMTIYLASRLLLAYTDAYNPSIESTFTKLNSVVPGPLREQIRMTIEWMQKRKPDQNSIHTLETLAKGWTSGRRVKIQYWTLGDERATERIIEPYFIQPAAAEHADYVIAYCHKASEIRIFKVDRIESIQLLDERYSVPEDFDANKYLGSAWRIIVDGNVKIIKLRFSPDIARIARETVWHPSQVTELHPDGSAIVTMNVSVTVELVSFILGWGEKVEVLEPEELREDVIQTAKAILKLY